MPSTPFDSAHQKSFRALIGKVLPDTPAQHLAEALAAGYGFPTHKAFGAAIRAVEAGRRPSPAPDFDADRMIVRLHGLGEDVGGQPGPGTPLPPRGHVGRPTFRPSDRAGRT